MREYSTPSSLVAPTVGNLSDDVVRNGVEHPAAVVCSRRIGEEWSDVTASRFLEEVRAVAKGLVAAGIKEGDRVALMSKTRYEWTLLDYAIWFAGAVSVPVYETSATEQIRHILSDSGARAVIVETAEHRARVDKASAELGGLQHVWTLDDRAIGVITALGVTVSEETLERRRTSSTPASLATLVYTSGTTGPPKGCLLSHGNFMSEIDVALDQLPELFDRDAASTLVFLPLPHIFARVTAVGAIRARVRLAHSCDVTTLAHDLASFRPSFVFAVPRVFEKLFNTAAQRAAADGRGRRFDRAVETAIAFSRARDHGGPGPLLRIRHRVFDRLVYRGLRATLGGRCEFAVSGGAPMGGRLAHFYRGIGLSVLEGYGLTETTAAVSVNLPAMTKIGTAGRPLPGTGVRIDDEGELLVRGAQVFSGYWNHEAATRQALTGDGWLHTGDLGEIDQEGFVRLTGRKEEMLVTTGGKHVAPSMLEDRVRAHPLVGQCMVVGDGRPFIAALVSLDPDTCTRWAEQCHKSTDLAVLAKDTDLVAEVDRAVERANQSVSRAESIRRFAVLPVEWTEEAGHLTPSLKLRRGEVLRAFRGEVEALFAR